MTLQEEIDSIIYPPTHTYQLEDLVPTGLLAERVTVIEKEFPEFFTGGYLLDVGCNKGFFSLYHQGPVIGIDPDEICITLCKKLKPLSRFYSLTFGEYLDDEPFPIFDKIFIGNGHHYPFIEASGWSWVEKLSNLCITEGFVLLEGPISMRGRDAKNCIPIGLQFIFNIERLLEAFTLSSFTLVKCVPSPLVNRYFFLFKKDPS